MGAGTDACAELNQNNGRKKRQQPPGPSTPTGPTDEQRELLAENLVRVDVYFETLSVQNITETPTYDVSGKNILRWTKSCCLKRKSFIHKSNTILEYIKFSSFVELFWM